MGICRESVAGGGDSKDRALEMGKCLDDGRDSREAGVARMKAKGRGVVGKDNGSDHKDPTSTLNCVLGNFTEI